MLGMMNESNGPASTSVNASTTSAKVPKKSIFMVNSAKFMCVYY